MKRVMAVLVKSVCIAGLVLGLFMTTQGAPAGAAEPIKIGVVLAITGWGAALGQPTKEAITIVAEDINAKGGVLGDP